MLPHWSESGVVGPSLSSTLAYQDRPAKKKAERQLKKTKEGATKAPNDDMLEPLSPNRNAIPLSYRPFANLQSLLMIKLPLEIRQKIYFYVLHTRPVHIWSTPGIMYHNVCLSYDLTRFAHDCCLEWPEVANSPTDIKLLRTCRQIYAEALPMLYSDTIFHTDNLNQFNFFPANTPQKAKSFIRVLHLSWAADFPPLRGLEARAPQRAVDDDATYLCFWRTVASQMSGLQELCMGITYEPWTRKPGIGDPWVGPVKEVRGLKIFELEIVRYGSTMLSRYPDSRFWDKNYVAALADDLRKIVCRTKDCVEED